jgi:hypothetical protein
VVTITPGVYMPNWTAAKSPQAWWGDTISYSGVEDMSLDHSASDQLGGITFFNCVGCWVKGVRSLYSNKGHVRAYLSTQSTVRDSYFYGTKMASSMSYGVEWFGASDILVENNVFEHIVSPFSVNGSGSGSVAAYNYSYDDYYQTSMNTMMGQGWLHAGGIDNILFEGNTGAGFFGDGIHGTHHFITLFRNRYIGFDTAGRTSQTLPVYLWSYSRYFNMIGNVLGLSGYHTQYQYVYPNPTGTRDKSIYAFGGSPGGSVPTDALVGTTAMRWGNYDTVNNAARWVSSEVPSGLSLYANPVPATQTLPASLYLSGKPGWFGSVPFPPIGPDVAGGDIANVGGHAYRIPAQRCYEQMVNDGSNAYKVFAPSTCYASSTSTQIAPPASVTAIAR